MNGSNRCCGKKYGNHESMHAMPLPYQGGMEGFHGTENFNPEMSGMNGMPGPGMNGMPGPGMNGMPGPGMNGMPGPGMNGMPGPGMNGMPVTRVVERPIHCPPNVFHHWQKVEHIVPVCVKNVHHCHTQHDYIMCKEPERNETFHHTHGLHCDKDFCSLAQQCPPRPCCDYM